MPRSRVSGPRSGTPGPRRTRLRPAEPASASPALRHVDRFPLPPAARSVRRGAPDAPARAPEQTISWPQPSSAVTVLALAAHIGWPGVLLRLFVAAALGGAIG